MSSALQAIGRAGIVPIVTLDDARLGQRLVEELVAAELPVVEITLRTPAGMEAIERAVANVAEAIVGAGSVMSADAATEALERGARFLASPGLAADVVQVAQEADVAVIPGVATATEVLHAVELGVTVVKLFPAEVIGGLALVDALAAVWPTVSFVPTGGIDADTVGSYLDHDRVLAVGGSWMIDRTTVATGDWAAVRAAAQACARLVESVG